MVNKSYDSGKSDGSPAPSFGGQAATEKNYHSRDNSKVYEDKSDV